MRGPGDALFEGHTVRPLGVVPRSAEQGCFLEWYRKKSAEGNNCDT